MSGNLGSIGFGEGDAGKIEAGGAAGRWRDGGRIVSAPGTVMPAAVTRKCGTSEVIYNALRGELYIRGYAFSETGAVATVATLETGLVAEPAATRLPRKDLLARFPDCPDPQCGFEFVIRDLAPDALPGSLRIHGARDDEADIAVSLSLNSRTARLPAELRIQAIEFNLLQHRLTVRGEQRGLVERFEFDAVMLAGRPLAKAEAAYGAIVQPREEQDGTGPRRRPFTITAAIATESNGQLFQLFPAIGQPLELSFRAIESRYRIRMQAALMASHLRAVSGVIHGIKTSPENGVVEIRGAFVGAFGMARVQLSVGRKALKRNARLEHEPSLVPSLLPRLLDAPFAEWVWRDELDIEQLTGATIKAELRDASRMIASVGLRVGADTIRKADELLLPAFHVSPLEEWFNAQIAKAVPFDAPLVLMVFPGDVFRTFGGGPTRIIEMARYLTAMGYAVGIVDQAAEQDGAGDIPDTLAEVFRFRIGLNRESLDEFVLLALDHIARESGGEEIRQVLSLAHERPIGLDDMLSRRTNHRFNALAGFLASIFKPDFVICNFAWTADVFDAVDPAICKILDIHDVQYLRGLTHREITGEDTMLTDLDNEVAAWRKADYVLAIQDEEKDFVIEHSGRNNVVVCTHASPPRTYRRSDDAARTVVFVGNRYTPNTLGIKAFMQRCWPAIRERVPDAVLRVVGNVGVDLDAVPEGVEVTGIVPDLGEVYETAAIVINPVEFGTGLSIKAVEALCYGRCLVTTASGMRGIRVGDATVRQTAAETMHEDVIELLLDPAARHDYEEEALRFAETELSAERVFRELFNTMELRLYS